MSISPSPPWEAALGAEVDVQTPDGSGLQLRVPANSASGLKLRLSGKGIPGVPPGDLYAVLSVRLPKADTPGGEEAYRALSRAFGDFRPRHSTKGRRA